MLLPYFLRGPRLSAAARIRVPRVLQLDWATARLVAELAPPTGTTTLADEDASCPRLVVVGSQFDRRTQ